VDNLHLPKVRLVVREADDRRVDYSSSNIRVSVEDGVATAYHRRKERRRADVVSIESAGIKDQYTITMTNGEIWETRGCGCGGHGG
jgi:hypothetical protein